MGTDASVFHQCDRFVAYRGRLPEEGTNRPLVTRMMKVPAFRSAYIERYKAALGAYLAKDYLLSQIAKLQVLVETAAQPDERETVSEIQAEVEEFIDARTAAVTAELAGL